jgi:hypothetical protein
MSHVFISYSRKDHDYAHQLASRLRSQDFHVWIDDRINSSEDWWQKIHQAIVECSAFIVIMTPESEGSKWVQREVTLAESLNKVAFPILLNGDPDISKSPYWSIYIRTQYTVVKNGEFPKPSFYEVLRSVVSANVQKIRFDGYYECVTHKHEGLNTFHITYAIIFMPDSTLKDFRIIEVGINVRAKHVLDNQYPDRGTYRVTGDIINIHITDTLANYRKNAQYHGYIEGDSLKLEIDEPGLHSPDYEVPWHMKERRLYIFKPFPETLEEDSGFIEV